MVRRVGVGGTEGLKVKGPPVANQMTALLIAAVLTACSAGNPVVGTEPSTPPTTEPAHSATSEVRLGEVEVTTAEYRPGLEADLHLRLTGTVQPVLVMVPGGAWETADRRGLSPLASSLAEAGVLVVNARIRAGRDGVVYPIPVEDVLCALAFGVARAEVSGARVGQLFIFGHSSGAHLAALGSLQPDRYSPSCSDSLRSADGLIGLSGLYDVDLVSDLASSLFGADRDEAAELWDEGNPIAQAHRRPELPVLLLHGSSDQLVPLSSTTHFAEALEAGGHQVTLNVLANADHHSIYSPEVAGDLLLEWITNVADG
jgi:acetyl esterase/lipase